MRLFETLGAWVADVHEPTVKLRLADNSRHHGWHAELLAERLPTVRELHPDVQTSAPNAEFEGFIAAMTELRGPDAPLDQLTATYRVLVPHLIAAQTWHLERCTPVADAAVIRTLGFILADEIADWRAAEVVLQAWCSDPAAQRRASDIRLRFDDLLAASGGISGPTTWVDPHDAVVRSSSGAADVDVLG